MSNRNKQSALKATIDRMVEDSIRRILPEVMNEVLLRTLTHGNVVHEQRRPQQQQRRQAPPQRKQQVSRQQQLAGIDRSMSLREALNADDAGADFYEQAEQAINQRQRPAQRQVPRPQPVLEQYDENELYGEDEIFDFDSPPSSRQAPSRQAVREQIVAQRISELPPALQNLAEDSFRLIEDEEYESDDGMWGANEFAPSLNEATQARAPNLNIDRAAELAGVDFNRARQLMSVTSQKHDKDPEDVIAENQWKRQQLERKRAELDRQKVG